MNDSEKLINKKYEELKELLDRSSHLPVISKHTVISFCTGFHLPLMGSLTYLQDNTATYQSIKCVAKVTYGDEYLIGSPQDYEVFARAIENITAPTAIDFTFVLKEGIYNTEDINVSFSVFFSRDEYIITYDQHGVDETSFKKKYLEDIDLDEILILRDKICDNIFKRVAQEMDRLLDQIK